RGGPAAAQCAGRRRRAAARRPQPGLAAAPQPRAAARPAHQPHRGHRAICPQWTDSVTSAWEEYLAAAQRLDTVRRDAATAAGARATAVQNAGQELAMVRQRLTLQRARLSDLATRAGMAAPCLTPDAPVPDP